MEVWKVIPSFQNIYQVSNYGRVRSFKNNKWGLRKTPKILKLNNDNGYKVVSLNQKKYHVSWLVLEAFDRPRPYKYVARHLDNNPSNNKLSNLKWGTNSQNQLDRIRHGTSNRGSANGMSKLNEKQVSIIRWWKKINPKIKNKEIVKIFKVSEHHISDIIHNRRWNYAAKEA